VVDRTELNMDQAWAETGDRYMLKLFRDYIFHQVMEDGRPFLDMAHVITSLNRLDAGIPDKVCLMSRDELNVLVVSYAELKNCLEQSYGEVLAAASAKPKHTNMHQVQEWEETNISSVGKFLEVMERGRTRERWWGGI